MFPGRCEYLPCIFFIDVFSYDTPYLMVYFCIGRVGCTGCAGYKDISFDCGREAPKESVIYVLAYKDSTIDICGLRMESPIITYKANRRSALARNMNKIPYFTRPGALAMYIGFLPKRVWNSSARCSHRTLTLCVNLEVGPLSLGLTHEKSSREF